MAFLFGKKKAKDEISELPELPELPPLPGLRFPPKQVREDLTPLPSFPSSQTGEQVTREAVKNAIREDGEMPEEEEEPLGEPAIPRTREIGEKEFEFQVGQDKIMAKEIPRKSQIKQATIVREIGPEMRVEPVYVRIDKYKESLINFQEIKKKVLEIENLLREIKEIKAKEEFQLNEWEREINEAKAKLDKIDRTIFQKLE